MDMSKCIDRFLEPQKSSYFNALEEVRNGRKVSHWMWYIFPQLRGLGQSNLAWYYGIENLSEAEQRSFYMAMLTQILELHRQEKEREGVN